jgi:arylsulfatase A-like enzyme/Ca2+-binding RTX toxin-like protein
MIVADDLNAWVSVLGGHAMPVATPNLDWLAATGVTFASAHATVPLCNPSRASVLSGMSPFSSGVLSNSQPMLEHIPEAAMLSSMLAGAGYHTVTSGKVFHGLSAAQAARLHDVVLSRPSVQTFENATPTATSLVVGVYDGDPDEILDARNVALVEEFLAGYSPDPAGAGLFLSVGLTATHWPLAVPQAYFDLYPIESIVLPGNPPGDLDDLPAFARQFINHGAYGRIDTAGEWRLVIQAYLATISYLDANVGRLLDALESAGIAEDTMVVFWSDNGLHYGEKGHVGKITLWENATRAPLIIADPAATDRHGAQVDTPVSLLDIYPTLLDYAGVPPPDWANGQSLRAVIETGDEAGLRGAALSMIDGNISLRTREHRYTRYEDGSEELYDVVADPGELDNRATDPAYDATRAALSAALDAELAAYPLSQNRTAHPALISGGAGDDVLIAGFGADTLAGGPGDDVYLLRAALAEVQENPGEGRDMILVEGLAAIALPENVEDLFVGRYGANETAPPLVTIMGNDLHNRIREASTGAVFANGGGGNDSITADFGPSTLLGGAGNDAIWGDAEPDLLSGGDGRDTLRGAGGADTLEGDADADRLIGEDGDDLLDGGEGDDTMEGGPGGDTYRVSAGADLIEDSGTDGIDILDITPWGLATLRITELRDTAGALTAVLHERVGTEDRVTVLTLTGTNPIEFLADGTLLYRVVNGGFLGSDAAETVLGMAGGDSLGGGGGNDHLDGAAGDDLLTGGAGADTLIGTEGNDTLVLEVMEGDWASGGPGDDLFLAASGSGTIAGGDGVDVLRLSGALTALSMTGVERIELGSYTTIQASWLGDAALTTVHGIGPGASIAVTGSAVADLTRLSLLGLSIAGDSGANTILVGTGATAISAGTGHDRVVAGEGSQTLGGGGGNDTLDGGPGADLLIGGPGNDLFLVDGFDTLSDSGGVDTVQSGHSFLLPDFIEGLVLTGDGNLWGTGNALRNLIIGNTGANLLTGHDGSDTLVGMEGDDTLVGGNGRDRLEGGGGADVFLYASAGEADDTIIGYSGLEDAIHVSAAGFGGGLRSGIDLISTGRYVEGDTCIATSAAGVGQFIFETTMRTLWWDADGTGTAARSVIIARLADATDWTGAGIVVID